MLSVDGINKLETENARLKDFLKWLLKQQYYILHNNLKKKMTLII